MAKPKTPKDLKEPVWERQEWETEAAYKAFTTYMELGDDRSLAEVERRLQGTTKRSKRNRDATSGVRGHDTKGTESQPAGRMKRWSTEHHWRKRILAKENAIAKAVHEAELDEAAQWARENVRLRIEANRTGFAIASHLGAKLLEIVEKLDKHDFKPSDVWEGFRTMLEMNREHLGPGYQPPPEAEAARDPNQPKDAPAKWHRLVLDIDPPAKHDRNQGGTNGNGAGTGQTEPEPPA